MLEYEVAATPYTRGYIHGTPPYFSYGCNLIIQYNNYNYPITCV